MVCGERQFSTALTTAADGTHLVQPPSSLRQGSARLGEQPGERQTSYYFNAFYTAGTQSA